MYINDVHILCYIIFALAGIVIGQFTDWIIKRLSAEKKLFGKGALKEFKDEFVPNYILMLVTALIYVALVYIYGWNSSIMQNLTLIKLIVVTPILISSCVIDYRLQIIPNRLNLSLFEIGLIFTFLYGFININIAADMCFGLLAGGGIFLLITLIRRINSRKRSNGIWRCKINVWFGANIWAWLYNYSNITIFFNRSHFKYCLNYNKKEKY